MSIAKSMEFIETPVRPTSKKGTRVISEMGSWSILWYLTTKHRVGLLFTSNVGLVTYILWDKVAQFLI